MKRLKSIGPVKFAIQNALISFHRPFALSDRGATLPEYAVLSTMSLLMVLVATNLGARNAEVFQLSGVAIDTSTAAYASSSEGGGTHGIITGKPCHNTCQHNAHARGKSASDSPSEEIR